MPKLIMDIKTCGDCPFYRYIRCHGSDCQHDKAPGCLIVSDYKFECDLCKIECIRKEEPLAENRIGDVPKWCPLLVEGKV